MVKPHFLVIMNLNPCKILMSHCKLSDALRFKLLPTYTYRSKSTVIDGKQIFENILNSLKKEVNEWLSNSHRPPRLSVVTAGYDPASMSYVKIKKKAAQFIGVDCDIIELNSGHSDSDAIRIIDRLNQSVDVDGILVQLPLYPHNNERLVCDAIVHYKDVDGCTTSSLGNVCVNKDYFVSCTGLAVHHILKNVIDSNFYGKHAVVIGRSKHVGLPIAMMLHSSELCGDIHGFNMTTTIVHRHTPYKLLVQQCESADVLVSAAGIPGFVKAEMVKPGAVVIDVGITKVKDPTTRKHLFKGDVDFQEVKKKAMYITTVPGGVGPVTVAMLMRNVVKAAKMRASENNQQEQIADKITSKTSIA